jgi:hypothetical protein
MKMVPKGKLTGHKVWLILDARAWEDPDAAAVYCAYSSHDEKLEDAKKDRDEEWPDGVIYEYDEHLGEDGVKYMINQRLIG